MTIFILGSSTSSGICIVASTTASSTLLSTSSPRVRPISTVVPLVFGSVRQPVTSYANMGDCTATAFCGNNKQLTFNSSQVSPSTWVKASGSPIKPFQNLTSSDLLFQNSQLKHNQAEVAPNTASRTDTEVENLTKDKAPLSGNEGSYSGNVEMEIAKTTESEKETAKETQCMGTETMTDNHKSISVGTDMDLPAGGLITPSAPKKVTMDACIQTDDLEEYIRSQTIQTTSAGTDMSESGPTIVREETADVFSITSATETMATVTVTTSMSATARNNNSNDQRSETLTMTTTYSNEKPISSTSSHDPESSQDEETLQNPEEDANTSQRIDAFSTSADDIVAGSKSRSFSEQLSIQIDDAADMFSEAPIRMSSPVHFNGVEVEEDVDKSHEHSPPILAPQDEFTPVCSVASESLNIVPPPEQFRDLSIHSESNHSQSIHSESTHSQSIHSESVDSKSTHLESVDSKSTYLESVDSKSTHLESLSHVSVIKHTLEKSLEQSPASPAVTQVCPSSFCAKTIPHSPQLASSAVFHDFCDEEQTKKTPKRKKKFLTKAARKQLPDSLADMDDLCNNIQQTSSISHESYGKESSWNNDFSCSHDSQKVTEQQVTNIVLDEPPAKKRRGRIPKKKRLYYFTKRAMENKQSETEDNKEQQSLESLTEQHTEDLLDTVPEELPTEELPSEELPTDEPIELPRSPDERLCAENVETFVNVEVSCDGESGIVADYEDTVKTRTRSQSKSSDFMETDEQSEETAHLDELEESEDVKELVLQDSDHDKSLILKGSSKARPIDLTKDLFLDSDVEIIDSSWASSDFQPLPTFKKRKRRKNSDPSNMLSKKKKKKLYNRYFTGYFHV